LPAENTCPTTCTPTTPGERTVLSASGTFLYRTPCRAFQPAGVLARCQRIQATGRRATSKCNELTCYAEVKVSGTAYWVPDFNCGKGAPRLLGLPGKYQCKA